MWHQVKFRDKIRVTKGKGKRIRLQCSISQSIDLKHLSILLVDLDKNCFFRPFDHFSIEVIFFFFFFFKKFNLLLRIQN